MENCGLHFVHVFDCSSQVSYSSDFSSEEDFPSICEKLAKALESELHEGDRRVVDKDDKELKFCIMKGDEKIYVCVCIKDAKLRVCYGMIEAIADDSEFDPSRMEIRDWKEYLNQKLEFYNNPGNDTIQRCKKEIERLNLLASPPNYGELVLEDIVEKTRELEEHAMTFRPRNNRVQEFLRGCTIL